MQWFKAQLHRYRAWPAGRKVLFWICLLRLLRAARLPLPGRRSASRPGCRSSCTISPAGCPASTESDRRTRTTTCAAPRTSRSSPRRSSPSPTAAGRRIAPNLHRENTLHAFDQAVESRLPLSRDRRPPHPRRGAAGLPRRGSGPGQRARRADRGPDATPRSRRSGSAGSTRSRRWPSCSRRFPHARFNIDAKSDRSVDLLAEEIAEHDAYDRVCVSSFGVRRLHRLRRLLGPRVAVGGEHGRGRAEPLRALADPGPATAPGCALQLPEYQRIGGATAPRAHPGPAAGGPSRRASRSTSGPSTTPRP